MGDLKAVRLLVDDKWKKVDGYHYLYVNARDEHGWTPLGVAYAQGHLKVAHFLMKRMADASKTGLVSLPLHEACISHFYETGFKTFQDLLEENECAIDLRDQHGKTPLQCACETDAPLDLIYKLISHDPLRAINSLAAQKQSSCS
jgi:ankyrin repeat protein